MFQRKKVLIADDHDLFRDGLKMLLSRNKELDLVGEAKDGREAVELARRLKPDLVIMDITMPGISGIEATRQITTELPPARVIILSVHSRKVFILQALEAGARSYVLKDSARAKLLLAVDAVLKGDSFLDSHQADLIINEYISQSPAVMEDQSSKSLTAREKQILRLIVDGHSNRQIAEDLFISPRTVDTHRVNIMAKLNIHDVVGLVKYAIASGMVDPDQWSLEIKT